VLKLTANKQRSSMEMSKDNRPRQHQRVCEIKVTSLAWLWSCKTHNLLHAHGILWFSWKER